VRISHRLILFIRRRLTVALLLTAACLLTCSCTTGTKGFATPGEDSHTAPPPTPLRIGIGDEIEIKFYFNPELNETARVRSDGLISLQLLDAVQVVGLTPEELDQELTSAYAKRLDRVDLTVFVRSIATNRVYVDGQVARPQAIELHPGMRVQEALASAGGALTEAKLESVLLMRTETDGTTQVWSLELDDPAKWQHNNLVLMPHDILYVPRSRIASANLFVKQYLSNMMPEFIRISFPITYSLNTPNATTTRSITIDTP